MDFFTFHKQCSELCWKAKTNKKKGADFFYFSNLLLGTVTPSVYIDTGRILRGIN